MNFIYALIIMFTGLIQEESIAQDFFNQSKQNTLMRMAICKYQTKKLDDNTVVVKWNCPWNE